MAFGIPFDQLYAMIGHYLLISMRVAALLITAPVFSEKAVSIRVRSGLAIMTAILIGGSLPQAQIELYSWSGVWTLAKQVIIGVAMGLTLQMLFSVVRMAGEIIGMQMGLSFAAFFDPGVGSTPVITRFLNVLAILLFLAFNGHLWLLALVAQTFQVLPVSDSPLLAGGFLALVQQAGVIFSQGLMLGLPVIALLLCITFTLGLLNRLAPQLSVFVIGFPLTLTVGMAALLLMLRVLSPFFERQMAALFDSLSALLLAF